MDGIRHYFDPNDAPGRRERYLRFLAEHESSGTQQADRPEITVPELAAAFWKRAQRCHRKPDGTPAVLRPAALSLVRVWHGPIRLRYHSCVGSRSGARDVACLRTRGASEMAVG